MAHYIDKDALVAEIERLENKLYYEPENFKDVGAKMALDSFKSALDTLEVKEVDLEKELDEWIKYGPHTNYPWCTIPDAIKITAKHFFELGLTASNKIQKGEKV